MADIDRRRRELARLAAAALGRRGVDFGDVRIVHREWEWLQVRGEKVELATHKAERGVAVRALCDGAWGFAGTSVLTEAAVEAAASRAAGIARVGARGSNSAVRLADAEPQQGTYRTPLRRDPFAVAMDEKLDLLFAATREIGSDEQIKVARASAVALRLSSALVNTEGTDIEQEIIISGGGIGATALGDGEFQRRTYPKDMEGNINAAGWEFVQDLDLVGNAPRIREEAVALLSAPACPAGERTVILDGGQLSLQIHESCGHPVELDRVLGDEISLAGASFLSTDRIGMRFGAPVVNISADATTPGGPGTFGWDDEGRPAGSHPIVRDGIFVGYLGSRETSARIGQATAAAFRAASWNRVPIVRMVNVNLAPGGAGTLEDLVADTDDGLLLSTNKSWSIDDLRLNFQFGCELAWEIKKGRRTRLLKNPVYSGITPRFWGGCDAIVGADDWRVWGWMFCGKGDPMQIMHVGHGCSSARFRDVRIGARQ